MRKIIEFIQEYLNSDVNTNNIILSDRILLLDANNHVVDIGFNYNYEDNLFGYITIGTHTKTTLVKEIACNQLLPEQYEEMYYLSNSEFYYLKDDNYYTLNNQKIPMDEFEDFLLHRIVGKQAQESLGLLVLVTGNVHHVDFDDVVCHQVT